MMEKIRAWLEAEARSEVLAKPLYKSYAALVDELGRALEATILSPAAQRDVRTQIMKIVASIIELRMKKILNEIRQGGEPRDLLEEEEALVAPLKRMRPSPKPKRRIVVFLKDYPAFTTSDFKRIGPFSKGDIAKLPLSDVEYLISKGIVEPFEI